MLRVMAMRRAAAVATTRTRLFRGTTRHLATKPPTSAPGSAPGAAPREALAREGLAILKLMFGGVAAFTAIVISSGFVIETTKQLNPMTPPGAFVELDSDNANTDGPRLRVHYQRRGHGDVTVILDGGVGEASFDWDKVATGLADVATVLAIDRPGLAFSEPGARPRTAAQVAKEYASILERLDVPRDVILVGHGAGGYNMRQLAHDLEQSAPRACKGLVLVDALQENLRGELEGIAEPVRTALEKMDANGDMVLRLARIGLIRLITTIQHRKTVEKYAPEAVPFVEFYAPTPAHREAANHENAALPSTEQAFRDDAALARGGFAFPSVVLSHGVPSMFDGMKVQAGVDARMIMAMEHKWQEAQRELAKTLGGPSTAALHQVVADAGHNIHHDKPEAIVRVVRALVKEAQHPGDDEGLVSLRDGACPI